MNLRITLFIIAGFFSGLILNGQEIPETLRKRNEIYFSFEVKAPSEINVLTNLISIDNVKERHFGFEGFTVAAVN